jgi:hypothetical protein
MVGEYQNGDRVRQGNAAPGEALVSPVSVNRLACFEVGLGTERHAILAVGNSNGSGPGASVSEAIRPYSLMEERKVECN